jgi:hypothetical protein
VRTVKRIVGSIVLTAMVVLAGCGGHKLVAHNGDTTVNVFPNKEDFDKVTSMKSQGGPAGMIGGLGESMMAKRVDNGTPVKILSSDPEGDTIEVLDGRDKGLRGYVSKDNVS